MKRSRHQSSDGARTNPSHGLVDRYDAANLQRISSLILRHNLELRLEHHQIAGAEVIRLRLAVKKYPLAFLKYFSFFEIYRVKPLAAQHPAKARGAGVDGRQIVDVHPLARPHQAAGRSEERRVGKEGRCRW